MGHNKSAAEILESQPRFYLINDYNPLLIRNNILEFI